MHFTSPGRTTISALLMFSLLPPALAIAESGAIASSTGPGGTPITVRSYNPGPGYAYSHVPASPAPVTRNYTESRDYRPAHTGQFYNRGNQRAYGRNDWRGSNRFDYWNDVINDMVTDMFGDAAGDFDVDLKIRFKAKGRGRGNGTAQGSASQDYRGNTHGDIRNRAYYSGREYGGQNPGYRGYAYPPYPTYPYAPYPPGSQPGWREE